MIHSEETPILHPTDTNKQWFSKKVKIFFIIFLSAVVIAGIVILIVFTIKPSSSPPCEDTVNTTEGYVQGLCTPNGRSFMGIPFATPPVGNLRFELPKLPEKRNSTLTVQSNRLGCIQTIMPPFPLDTNSSEDCLYLNVLVPSRTTPGELLPVFFFVHGGGYLIGNSSSWNGFNLATQVNYVVVTISYRLGALGFLAHPALTGNSTQKISGNYGVADSFLALQWVKSNIQNFGGDPNKITIAGVSAGGVTTMIMLLSNLTKGLFKNVIVYSANFWTTKTLSEREMEGQDVAENIWNCTGTNSDILKCLRSLPSEKFNVPNRSWGVNLDNYYVLGQPRDIYETIDFGNVSVMLGSTQGELGWYDAIVNPSLVNSTQVEVESYINATFNSSELWNIYNFSVFPTPFALRAQVLAEQFNCNLKLMAKRMTNRIDTTKNNSLFLLRFDHLLSTLPSYILKAPHGSDQPFLFNERFCFPVPFCRSNQQFSSEEISLSEKYQTFSTVLSTSMWKKFSIWNETGLRFGPGDQAQFEDFSRIDNCVFWEKFLSE